MPVGATEKLDIKELLRAHDEEDGLRLSDDDLLEGVREEGAPPVVVMNDRDIYAQTLSNKFSNRSKSLVLGNFSGISKKYASATSDSGARPIKNEDVRSTGKSSGKHKKLKLALQDAGPPTLGRSK